LTDVGYFVDTF